MPSWQVARSSERKTSSYIALRISAGSLSRKSHDATVLAEEAAGTVSLLYSFSGWKQCWKGCRLTTTSLTCVFSRLIESLRMIARRRCFLEERSTEWWSEGPVCARAIEFFKWNRCGRSHAVTSIRLLQFTHVSDFPIIHLIYACSFCVCSLACIWVSWPLPGFIRVH